MKKSDAGLPLLAGMPGYGAAFIAASLAVFFAGMIPAVTAGEILLWSVDWAPSLGVSLSFMVDGLSLIFALLISGIGALIFLYNTTYSGGHPQAGRLTVFLFAFMLSMLGLVLARDLITLFVFWELTSVTSYLLIGFDHKNPQARRSALQAMLITATGGLAMLAGFILINTASGTFDLAEILAGPGLQQSPVYIAVLLLVLAGAFTKSAQFPFHFWLPNAMAAPTPVSAYLHSATMVKAGVYLMARLHPVLGGTDIWTTALGCAGLITAVTGAVLALRQTDLKQVLACTTLMALGTITLFLASDTPEALTAAMMFLIVHALYKAALFMVAGAVDHATGTRDIRTLSGLRRVMPLTALAAVLAGASMAGLPPLAGWIGKELLYAGATTMPLAPLVAAGVLVANALMVAAAGIIALRPFTGPLLAMPAAAHETPWQMLTGPLVLAITGLACGLFSPVLISPLLGVTVAGSLGAESVAALHLWGGIHLPFVMSLVTFALGIYIFFMREHIRAVLADAGGRLPGFDLGWDRLLDAFRRFAAWQTGLIQNGRAVSYLTVVFCVLTLAMVAAILRGRPVAMPGFDAPLLLWLIGGFTVAGAVLALNIHSRIAAIAGIGTVGIGVALIFICFGAPDVAITQLMVETLAAVLFGIAALRLPGMNDLRSRAMKQWHAIVAIATGLVMAFVVLAVTMHPLDRHISDYFEQNSWSMAHGLNIVNVILVDFRAFDTLGELTVVLLAGIGAFALLKRRDAGRQP